jgi:hypothetical protein
MPNVYGSTRGLRNIPCRITPARLKLPPIANAKRIRGSRTSKMMLYSAQGSLRKTTSTIFLNGIEEDPTNSEKQLIAISAAIRNSNHATHRYALLFTFAPLIRDAA